MAEGRPARSAESMALVPVHVAEPAATPPRGRPPRAARLEIGLPGWIKPKGDSGVDPEALAAIVGVLQRRPAPSSGPGSWALDPGAGDAEEGPVQGHLFVFRGRSGNLVKVLWWDGQGFCLFAKRLNKGRFVWPMVKDGAITLTPAQLAMLLEGID